MTEIDDELAAIVEARVGQTVCSGKYRIDAVLGTGGMASVYAGVHRNGRRVAMKFLHPEYSRRSDIRKRFIREGQAANAVVHAGVVAVIDDDVAE
jgi:serine/threonine protein kinase